jgi:hypothetical protein
MTAADVALSVTQQTRLVAFGSRCRDCCEECSGVDRCMHFAVRLRGRDSFELQLTATLKS